MPQSQPENNNFILSKKTRSFPLSFVWIFAFLFLFTSCKGQEGQTTQSNASSVPFPMRHGSNNKDALFFIEGQLCQHLRKITQDKNGDLWFGTNVYGLMRYDGDTLIYFDDKNLPFDFGRVTGFVFDKDSVLWISSYEGLTRYDGKSFKRYGEKEGLLSNETWCLTLDSKGIFWVGTTKGVSTFDGHTFTTFDVPKPNITNPHTVFAQDRIVSIVEDKKGNMWFGTDGFGIIRYNSKTFTHFTTEDGLCDNTIHEMKLDAKGHLWTGTFYGGVSLYDGQTFTNFTKDGKITGEEVSGFYEDKKGNMWFAAENHGIYCYTGDGFIQYNEKDGLNTNSILSIFEDKEGRFWFGGWGGLFRFDGKTFVSVTKEGPWGI